MTNPSPGTHLAVELASQPEMWGRAADLAASGAYWRPLPGERLAAVGCGTSWFMAQSFGALREGASHGATDAFAASESPLPSRREYDAVVLITRSGTTTEVLELARRLRGITRTVGVIGDVSSPLVDLVDDVVPLPFADERSVVQTRFATTALSYLRASLGADLTRSIADAERALREEPPAAAIDAEQLTFIGTGWSVGLAHEAALKLREASQSWTESYPSMEYRHGPLAIAGPGRLTWAFGEVPAGLAADVAATGAHLESSGLDPLADLVRVHRIALERALARGLDPDAPRHLTRSVVLNG